MAMATIKVPREVYTLVEKSLEKAREAVAASEQRVKESQERLDAAKAQVKEIEGSLKQMEPSEISLGIEPVKRRGRPPKEA